MQGIRLVGRALRRPAHGEGLRSREDTPKSNPLSTLPPTSRPPTWLTLCIRRQQPAPPSPQALGDSLRVDELVDLQEQHVQEIQSFHSSQASIRALVCHSTKRACTGDPVDPRRKARHQVNGRSSAHPSPNPPGTSASATFFFSFATATCTKHTPQV
jgi:hypothetical protein